MTKEAFFERVVCISLARRPERWQEFLEGLPADWPFGPVERYEAIDGQRCKPPAWYKAGGGGWGCTQSHLRVIEECLNRGTDSVLLLEDDAVACDGLAEKWNAFAREVPADWEVLYLGGQHLHVHQKAPEKINEDVYRPHNVNRTHAWALRGRGLEESYRHLLTNHKGQGARQIIDNHMGRLIETGKLNAYCPADWLFYQRDGHSDVCDKDLKLREWEGAETVAAKPTTRAKRFPMPRGGGDQAKLIPGAPFVAVIGLHSSGTSALAGVCHHLGVHLGNTFTGYYGSNARNPDKGCGFEAVGLCAIIRRGIRWPENRLLRDESQIEADLRQWIANRQHEAQARDTLAGGKHPLLLAAPEVLTRICGDNLKVIHASRPLEESIRSFVRREKHRHDPKQLEAHQRWLWGKKVDFLERNDHLTVEYRDLLQDPAGQARRIAEYLGRDEPTEEELGTIERWVKPEQRHVRIETPDNLSAAGIIPAAKIIPDAIPRADLPVWTYWQPGPIGTPPIVELMLESIARHNPTAQVLDDAAVIELGGQEVLDLTRRQKLVNRSDLLRFWLLKNFGGAWLDADYVCTKPVAPLLDPLDDGVDFVARLNHINGRVASNAIASRPGGDYITAAWEEGRRRLAGGKKMGWLQTGPKLLTSLRSGRLQPHLIPTTTFPQPGQVKFRATGTDAQHEKQLRRKVPDAVAFHTSYRVIRARKAWSRDQLLESDELLGYLFREALGLA